MPLSHGNLAASISNIVATYELTPEDRSLLVMPLFHVHGLMAGAYGLHDHALGCAIDACFFGCLWSGVGFYPVALAGMQTGSSVAE